jgi:outer membrane lipase/esterase
VLFQLSFLPGIHIVRFDVNLLLGQIEALPSSFGLINVTDACIQPGEPPFVCDSPDSYLWWDGIHPTKAAHAILGRTVGQALGFLP